MTNSASVSSSETQVMQSGHDLAGIVCPKQIFFFFFLSWISSAGSDSPDRHASTCVGIVEVAAWREGTNCQGAWDHY